MNRSPLIINLALIASLSLLNIGSAASAAQLQEKPKATAASKAKATKAQIAKTKAAKAKLNRIKADEALAACQEALKQAKAELPKSAASTASAGVKTNPYFADQPLAILPLAVQPVIASQAASASSIPDAPEKIASTAATAVSTTSAYIAPQAAVPAPVNLPSLAPPIYGQTEAVAVAPVKQPIAAYPAYQSSNIAVANYRNPYLNYPQPAVAKQDPVKLFSDFGSGLKITSPAMPQTGYAAPAVAAPVISAQTTTSNASTSSTKSLSSMFSSLKMMVPLTGDSDILPTIKKVYPTGEKPLVVINFKCPTELIGITPPPMKLLHEALNLGFDGLNKTNLLSFNLQQVCS